MFLCTFNTHVVVTSCEKTVFDQASKMGKTQF